MKYSEELKSPKWQRKRLEVLNRDNFTCCLCGDTETELHVHHLKYNGKPYESDIQDLETLCWVCHNYNTFQHKEIIIEFSIDPKTHVKNHTTKTLLISEFIDQIILYEIDSEKRELNYLVSFWKEGKGIDLIKKSLNIL